MPSQKISGFKVQGYNTSQIIDLPAVFSRPDIPIDRSHIARPDSFVDQPHLKDISSHLSYFSDIEIGLLIGFDCPEASVPLKVVLGSTISQPYAVETPLGWTIIGSKLQSNFKSLVPSLPETSSSVSSTAINVKPTKCASLLMTCSTSSSSTTVSSFYQHRTHETVHSNRRNLRRNKFDPSSSIQTVKKICKIRDIPAKKPSSVNYIV